MSEIVHTFFFLILGNFIQTFNNFIQQNLQTYSHFRTHVDVFETEKEILCRVRWSYFNDITKTTVYSYHYCCFFYCWCWCFCNDVIISKYAFFCMCSDPSSKSDKIKGTEPNTSKEEKNVTSTLFSHLYFFYQLCWREIMTEILSPDKENKNTEQKKKGKKMNEREK